MIFKVGDVYKNNTNDVLCYLIKEDKKDDKYLIYWKYSDGSSGQQWYRHCEMLSEMSKGYLDVVKYGDGGLIPSWVTPHNFLKGNFNEEY